MPRAAGCCRWGRFPKRQAALAGEKLAGVRNNKYVTDEKLTPFDDIKQYNNFYEFGTAKDDPAVHAKNFQTRPWTIEVGGEIANPKTYDTDEIMKLAPLEERIYRLRCVEAWSMVVPWIGFPLNAVIRKAEPNSKAKYVAFETYYDPKQMPLGRSAGIQFALRGRAAAGRGDAPAGAAELRHLWRGAAEPERRAAPAGGAVEVWFQEHQVDHQDQLRREGATHDVETFRRRGSMDSIPM